jgi:hypothetical protein
VFAVHASPVCMGQKVLTGFEKNLHYARTGTHFGRMWDLNQKLCYFHSLPEFPLS